MQLIPEFNGPISASHGLCYLCHLPRRAGDEGVVDTGINIHMEGGLEICKPCIVEMAAMFGCLTPEKSKDLLKANREYGRKAQNAEKKLAHNDQIARLLGEIKNLDSVDAGFKP